MVLAVVLAVVLVLLLVVLDGAGAGWGRARARACTPHGRLASVAPVRYDATQRRVGARHASKHDSVRALVGRGRCAQSAVQDSGDSGASSCCEWTNSPHIILAQTLVTCMRAYDHVMICHFLPSRIIKFRSLHTRPFTPDYKPAYAKRRASAIC